MKTKKTSNNLKTLEQIKKEKGITRWAKLIMEEKILTAHKTRT
ncbi:hypothetical protein [Sessilibacter sp. MAH4]